MKKIILKKQKEDIFLNKKLKRINNKDDKIIPNYKKIHFLKILVEYPECYGKFDTFCAFNSIDDILFFIFGKNGSIICYNLIDNKKINEIKNAHKKVAFLRHFFDEINKRDLVISFPEIFNEKGFKLWNINNFECLYNFDKIYNNNSEISACILNDKIENYIVTGCVDKDSETIKIFNLRGNKTKEIMVNNYVYYITSYFYKKLSQLFIIVGSYNCIKTFDFENDKEFNSYYSSEIKSNNRYYGVIDQVTKEMLSYGILKQETS